MNSLDPLQARIRAVLFDVYGTLVHIQNPKSPYRQLLKLARELQPISKEQGSRDIICSALGLTEAAGFYGAELSAIQQCRLELDLDEEIRSLRLYPEVPEVLRTLRARGYRVGLCSNLALPYVLPVAHLLEGMFDVAIWSCEVGAIKPDPEIYAMATLRLGFEPAAVLMVGDNYQADVEGPRLAGLHAVHLDRRNGGGDLGSLEGLLDRLT